MLETSSQQLEMGNLLCPKKNTSNQVQPVKKEVSSIKNQQQTKEVIDLPTTSLIEAKPAPKAVSETITQANFNQKSTKTKDVKATHLSFSRIESPSQKITLTAPPQTADPEVSFADRSMMSEDQSQLVKQSALPSAPKLKPSLVSKPASPAIHIFDLLNSLRTNPSSWSPEVAILISDLCPRTPNLLHSRRQATKEGLSALREAETYLNTTSPVFPFTLDAGLSLAAHTQAVHLSAVNELTHTGPTVDTATARRRAEIYGRFLNLGMQGVGEVIFSGVRGESEALLSVVIDDGMPGRPNREMMFDERATKVGIGVCPPPPAPSHGKWYYCILIGWSSYVSDPEKCPKHLLKDIGIA